MKSQLLTSLVILTCSANTAYAQITIADAGPDTSLCVNFYTLTGNVLAPGEYGLWVMVAGCGAILNPTDPNSQIWDLCMGTNVLQWVIQDSASATTDQLVITVYDSTIQTANAGVNVQITVPNTSTYLSANPYAYPCSCMWTIVQGSGTISDPTDPNTFASGLTVGSNIFRWTCDNGACGTTSDSMTVEVLDPAGVTPLSNSAPVVHFDPRTGNLVTSTGSPVLDVRIMDMEGRSVHIGTVNDGIYLAVFEVDDRQYRQPFVVAR
jgi:hypothetical protein